MSLLATVVSEGSPGSSFAAPLAVGTLPSPEDLRTRFGGGTEPAASIEDCFLGLFDGAAGLVDSSASSPDASRDDGCRRSVVDDLGMSSGRAWEGLRLRFPAIEDGDDILNTNLFRGMKMRRKDNKRKMKPTRLKVRFKGVKQLGKG